MPSCCHSIGSSTIKISHSHFELNETLSCGTCLRIKIIISSINRSQTCFHSSCAFFKIPFLIFRVFHPASRHSKCYRLEISCISIDCLETFLSPSCFGIKIIILSIDWSQPSSHFPCFFIEIASIPLTILVPAFQHCTGLIRIKIIILIIYFLSTSHLLTILIIICFSTYCMKSIHRCRLNFYSSGMHGKAGCK